MPKQERFRTCKATTVRFREKINDSVESVHSGSSPVWKFIGILQRYQSFRKHF